MKLVCLTVAALFACSALLSFAEEPELVKIQNDRLSVSINPTGAELWSVASREPDQEFLWQGDPEFWGDRAPIMFPVNVKFKGHKFSHNGKSYDMPLLGVVKDARFKVLPSASKDSVDLELESDAETLKHYPFPFRFRVKYLIQDQSLTVTYSVINTGDETMYFAIGGHPGLATPIDDGRSRDDYELSFSKALTLDRIVIEDGLHQSKTLPYLRNENTLRLHDARVPDSGMFIDNCQARQIGVALAGRPPYAVIDLGTFPNVNIWTPQRMPFVCIEPMAAHHDLQDSPAEIGLKSYLLTLDAGQQKDFQFSIHVHPENWTQAGDPRKVQSRSKPAAVPFVDAWQRTTRKPNEGWMNPDFELDKHWYSANGGFGTESTPGARVGSYWNTKNIWLRKEYRLAPVPENPALWVHHDEDIEVFFNGKSVWKKKGFAKEYQKVTLDAAAAGLMQAGRNILAVHCKQSTGGQFVDVHLVDAQTIPELPPANMRPFQSDLITTWGERVTAENAWTEYPRPQLTRKSWTNLNGQWDYAIVDSKITEVPQKWQGKILVPFCLEAKLGGVSRLLNDYQTLWYRRSFESSAPANKKTLLNFEAVDYACEVFVNGQSVGKHVGGNDPFTFDVSQTLQSGQNDLMVKVRDATEGFQLRGKQKLEPHAIFYTRVSGIWQTVWLEEVPTAYVKDLKIKTDAAAGTITVNAATSVDRPVSIEVKDGGNIVATGQGTGDVVLPIRDAKLWSPDQPHLYDIHVSIAGDQKSGDDPQMSDHVQSYAGIRTVGKIKDNNGHWRLALNGKPIFHWGPLDQGWWPDGLLTPPSDEGMLFDIQWLKKAGFNMIRKHIKVEPRRYYYHCDRLGMMVWQDQVSGGTGGRGWPEWTRLKPEPAEATWKEEDHQQYMLELEEMISSLENHPSIVVWVPFNERWGQHNTLEVGKWTAERDPTRLLNIASGGNFFPIGDIVDAHNYPHPKFPFQFNEGGRFDRFIKVMGEFGGHGLAIQGHQWDASRRNWGYGGLPKNSAEYRSRYQKSIDMLNELRDRGIAGGVYTQTTDVEGEINGLMTYDRKVIKVPAQELAEIHKALFE